VAVYAPSTDPQGALLDAAIASAQTLVTVNKNPTVLYQLQQALNALQVQAVDHYMVTGWLNAGTILAAYPAPAWDTVGQALTARVAFLKNLVANAPAMPAGNAEGYGSSGWTTVVADYEQKLYAAQITLVEHIMALPGGTSAATMLAELNGYQSFPFEYVFNSVGYTDEDIDD
jgi:hypothetical protein